MRIYVASSWRNEHQGEVVSRLRAEGFEVYDFKNPHSVDGRDYGTAGVGFHWSSIDPNYKSWSVLQYTDALEDNHAEEGFASDMSAMEWADIFILVLPCGRSAHLEAGWACGAGKPTCIYIQGEELIPELMYKMADSIASSLDDVVCWANEVRTGDPCSTKES